jgi:methylthioribose-1-phosphate isomerase
MKNLKSLGLRYEDGQLYVLDQQLLPQEEVWLKCNSPEDMVFMIKNLKIRGAPLIGVAAVASLARFAEEGHSVDKIMAAARSLRDARPTAVNLAAAVDRAVLKASYEDLSAASIVETAESIFDEDVELCLRIAENGVGFINDGDSILTHCNSGGLATAGIGTALGIIHKAHQMGKKIHVYVDETRPLLQGARLTTWELKKLKIPHTLICDNMAASLMVCHKIQKVFVGADRIAKSGDFANKIGTYSVAALSRFHHIPFYVAAPYTTVDLKCATGKDIPIEERPEEEVQKGRYSAIFNPAFDVTPAELATAIILDKGVFKGLEFGSSLGYFPSNEYPQ